MTIIFQANHEQALQDAAKKSNKKRGEVEDQIADMKVMRFGQTQFHRLGPWFTFGRYLRKGLNAYAGYVNGNGQPLKENVNG